MKIFVTGTRGIPDIPGGVEKHCEELFPLIAAKGHDVFLCTRNSYVTQKTDEWRGVKLINCFAPRRKSFEAIVHTFIALLKARWYSPDVVHINAIGSSLLTPFARLMGLRVVVTNHGPDYDCQKWGRVAKFVLRLGEKMGALYANEVIVISSVIANIIRERCHRESNLIYNGVNLQEMNIKEEELKLLLAIKLFEEGAVSLGKAAETAGYSEKAFVEVLIRRGMSPIKYSELDLDKEARNA